MDVEYNLPSPPRLLEKLDALAQQQSSMLVQNTLLAQQNATLISQNVVMAERLTVLEGLLAQPAPTRDLDWVCPVCGSKLTTRDSLKGHIRRLIFPQSATTSCFLDSENADHQALLAHPRYGEGNFEARAQAFKSMLYDTVKSSTRSTMSSENSFSAVSARQMHV